MTKKELEQLIDLKKEIKELEQSILKIQQMYIGDAPVSVDASKKIFHIFKGKQSFMDTIQYLQKSALNIYVKRRCYLTTEEKRQRKRKRD